VRVSLGKEGPLRSSRDSSNDDMTGVRRREERREVRGEERERERESCLLSVR
jgi:hypothetical protein